MKKISYLCALGLLSFSSSYALACTAITSIPTTISTAGKYCLTGDVSGALGAGSAITISASNVEIDLQGWTIENTAAATNWAYGIQVGPGPDYIKNAVVKNGRIVNFDRGIQLYRSNHGMIENMDIDSNGYGIYIIGMHQQIHNSTIRVDPTASGRTTAFGIQMGTSYITVKNNEIIIPTANLPYVRGISSGAQDIVVEDNVFRLPCNQYQTNCIAVDNANGGTGSYANNRIFGAYKGLVLGAKSGYFNNVAESVVPYTGGIDMGNNKSISMY